jgi:hypothetical protein
MDHIERSSVPKVRNIDVVSFVLGWAQWRSQTKHIGTCYAKHVFLHMLQSTNHVVHSSASGVWNIDALFSCSNELGVDPLKSTRVHYSKVVFLHSMWSVDHVVRSDGSGVWNVDALFFCSGRHSADPIKSVIRHITLNLYFTSGAIYGSCSAYWCIRGVKHRHTIFHARVGPMRIP